MAMCILCSGISFPLRTAVKLHDCMCAARMDIILGYGLDQSVLDGHAFVQQENNHNPAHLCSDTSTSPTYVVLAKSGKIITKVLKHYLGVLFR